MAKSVFISHSSRDDAIVRELRQALSNLGIETWADSERSPAGKKSRMPTASWLVILNALNSEGVQRETASRFISQFYGDLLQRKRVGQSQAARPARAQNPTLTAIRRSPASVSVS